jgi:hypothetical protein
MWKKQFASSCVNGESKVALKAQFKSKGMHEDGSKSTNSYTQKPGKGIKYFYCGRLGHKNMKPLASAWFVSHFHGPFPSHQAQRKMLGVQA